MLNKKGFISAMIGVVTGFINGIFGSGGGTVIVPALERFLKIEPHKAHATAIAVILPLSALSMLIYINNIEIDFMNVIIVSLGGIAGGFFGAKLLNKISDKWLHKIFGAFMIAAAVKMIL